MKKIIMAAMAAVLAACVADGSVGRRADSNGMYRVKSGDTLVLIARANGVDYTDIMRWNNLSNPNRLEVGWRLRVRPNPKSSGEPPPIRTNTTSNGVASTTVNTKSATAERDLSSNPDIKNTIAWRWPTSGALLTRFDGATYKGVELAGSMGAPVFAAAGGEVLYAGSGLRGYGNMVVINHSDSWSSVYANNSRLLVKKGDRVDVGQEVAQMGSSDASRVQLYFEVRLNAKPIDPLKVLPAR